MLIFSFLADESPKCVWHMALQLLERMGYLNGLVAVGAERFCVEQGVVLTTSHRIDLARDRSHYAHGGVVDTLNLLCVSLVGCRQLANNFIG